MTKFASLDRCRKLYEITKWGEKFKDEKLDLWGVAENGNASVITQSQLDGFPVELIPAYDLGYLIRKLPLGSSVHTPTIATDKACVAMYKVRDTVIPHSADSPENAAADLLLDLIGRKIVKL